MNELAASMATRKYREAAQWIASFERAVHRVRCWTLIFLARRATLSRLSVYHAGRSIRDDHEFRRFNHVVEQLDQAHDMIVMESENMETAARCAMASEIAGRIFDEEHEERERGTR
jgi:hypothetical protein